MIAIRTSLLGAFLTNTDCSLYTAAKLLRPLKGCKNVRGKSFLVHGSPNSLNANAHVPTLDARIPLGKPLKDSLEAIKHVLEENDDNFFLIIG